MTDILTADVVVVGSGVAGALLAATLAEAGVAVLILEAGADVDRNQAVRHFQQALVKVPECAYPTTPQAMHPVSDQPGAWYVQAGPTAFQSTYLKVVGGTTWHWLGSCPRFLPSDFAMQSRFGRAVDWPLSYDTLEPDYLAAERELGVSGSDDDPLGSPRSGPYPMPAIPPTYLDRRLAAALQDSPYHVRATPQARNSQFHNLRPPCCGSASCIPVCPIGAKYDATVHVRRAQAAGARLLSQATVVRLEADAEGRIQTLSCRRWDGSVQQVQGRIVVLAANAIETPRLLLASRSARYPQGLANQSDQVGRNLMDHPVQLSWALAKAPVYPYRGPLSTSGIENLRDGEVRRQRSAFRIEIGNDGWSWPVGAPASTVEQLIAEGVVGAELDARLAHLAARHVRLASLTEQEPDPDNRVTLDPVLVDLYGVPRPRLHYRLDAYVTDGLAAARAAHDDIFSRLGVSESHHAPEFFGAGHILGTTRMGRDPRQSVVDATLRSHDHPNLYLVGGGVFPTVGTANPTLTIAALSLRAAAAIQAQLRGSGLSMG